MRKYFIQNNLDNVTILNKFSDFQIVAVHFMKNAFTTFLDLMTTLKLRDNLSMQVQQLNPVDDHNATK